MFVRSSVALVSAALFFAACSSNSSDRGAGGAHTSGGAIGSGGVASTGGVPNTGGNIGTGGVTTTGGAPSTGGNSGLGGAANTGGTTATGGKGGGGGSAAGGFAIGGSNGSGSGGGAGSTSNGGSSGGSFKLTSADFVEGATIPKDATCENTGKASLLPTLMWTAPPAGTKSFAMTFLDTTILDKSATDAKGMHYAIYDIPMDATSLPQGLPSGSPPAGIDALKTAKQVNPLGPQYLGPCPNTSTPDHYAFTLYALSQDKLTGTLTNVQGVVNAIKAAKPLGMAVLTGTSKANGTLK